MIYVTTVYNKNNIYKCCHNNNIIILLLVLSNAYYHNYFISKLSLFDLWLLILLGQTIDSAD